MGLLEALAGGRESRKSEAALSLCCGCGSKPSVCKLMEEGELLPDWGPGHRDPREHSGVRPGAQQKVGAMPGACSGTMPST